MSEKSTNTSDTLNRVAVVRCKVVSPGSSQRLFSNPTPYKGSLLWWPQGTTSYKKTCPRTQGRSKRPQGAGKGKAKRKRQGQDQTAWPFTRHPYPQNIARWPHGKGAWSEWKDWRRDQGTRAHPRWLLHRCRCRQEGIAARWWFTLPVYCQQYVWRQQEPWDSTWRIREVSFILFSSDLAFRTKAHVDFDDISLFNPLSFTMVGKETISVHKNWRSRLLAGRRWRRRLQSSSESRSRTFTRAISPSSPLPEGMNLERNFFAVGDSHLAYLLTALCISFGNCSGGGYRAMISSLGYMKAAKKAGLFDCTMYMAGVSGSCWMIAQYLTLGQRSFTKTMEHFKQSLSTPIAHYPSFIDTMLTNPGAAQLILEGIVQKYSKNRVLTLVDAFGTVLASRLLIHREQDGDNGEWVDPLDFKMSQQSRWVNYGDQPLPIYTAVSHVLPGATSQPDPIEEIIVDDDVAKEDSDEHYYQWFEMTPYEFGSEETSGNISCHFIHACCFS